MTGSFEYRSPEAVDTFDKIYFSAHPARLVEKLDLDPMPLHVLYWLFLGYMPLEDGTGRVYSLAGFV